jgi:glutathione S-transferase
MAEIILHHYPRSPFSEKVRLAFGAKGIEWRSVEIPMIAPKPDLMPLTGGYRKTPVMQIGADIFCDTRIILREIDHRFPKPHLHGKGGGEIIATWADYTLFLNTVGMVMGTYAARIPKEMKDDRLAFTDGLFDADRFDKQQPALRAAFHANTAMIEHALRDQRAFVTGDVPDIADFSLYHPLWFVRMNFRDTDFLADYPATAAWFERMKAFGQGKPTTLDAKEALAIAKAAQPAAIERRAGKDASGCQLGERVHVAANDYGRDPVEGDLLAIDDQRITIHRHDAELGHIHLHFPRLGFDVARA